MALALCCLALAVLLFGANATFAQEVTATIAGTVTDASGAAVAGATVTAKSVERGETFAATTNDAGIYRIPQLRVGSYDLKVEKTGFQTSLYPAFVLHEAQVATIDVQLKVGQVSQTIEVTGAAPVLKTESTQVDTIIDAATNDALPLATRNYTQLTLLAPGSIHPDPSSFTNGDNTNNGGRPFINGNREQSDNFLLDGMDNNEVSDNLNGYTPAPDAIEEFNLVSNNAPAEFGNFMGGIVSATIKSGTNGYHGDLWEFFRNNVLNADQWENKINPTEPAIPTAPVRWNMFGATFGGPIIKNKLFFFMDFQGQRLDFPPAAGYLSVFTPTEQAGNLGALCTNGFTNGICNDRVAAPGAPSNTTCAAGSTSPNCVVANQLYNPCANAACTTPTAPSNGIRPPFLNNVIPSNMLSSVATALFASPLYPKTINNNLVNNAYQFVGNQLNNDQGDIRIDYRIDDKDSVSGRFTRAFQSDPTSNSQPLVANSLATVPIWSTVGDWTRSISPTLVNDMRFGWNHIVLNTGSTWDPSVGNFGESIGIANSNPGTLQGLIGLAFGGGTPSGPTCGTISCIGNSLVTQSFNSQVWQYNDDVTWTRGRHTLKLGGEYMFDIIKVYYSGNSGALGNITFGPNFTASSATTTAGGVAPYGGNGMGDFLLGLPSTFGRGISSGGWTQTSNVWAGYAQDTWRRTDHLTFTLGLRYELHTPWIERNDEQLNYNIRQGQLQTANQNGASRSLYNGVYGPKDLQPRLGFAWTPARFDGKTVIRGAFTISDYLEGTGTNLRLPLNAPFDGGATTGGEFQTLYTPTNGTAFALPSTNLSQGIIAPPSTGLSCPNFTCYEGAVFRLWDSNVQPAIDNQTNLTIQHQFAGNTTLQVGYVGQIANHLMVPFKYNQLVYVPGGTPQPSLYFQNGIGPQLAAAIDSTGGTVSGTQSNGRMMYNALQAVLQKTMSKGLQGQVSYTFSKCMTNNSGYYGTWSGARGSNTASPYWQNVYDPGAEWAPCYYDSTNTLTAYAVYDLPVGKGRQFGNDMNRAVNAIVGGWTVSPILSWHTGFPMAMYNNGGDPTGTFSGGIRPDCNGQNQVYGRQDATAAQGGGFLWFNPANYTNNTSGFGTCAPQLGHLRGPGYYNWDISLQKNFQLTERFRLQFRSDFLNAFNAVNLAAPNTTVDTSTTGVIQASQPARNIQFALKLYF
ncbi:MAG: TonB-dependent receptor [Candidatus Acidiferrum sp.]